MNKLKELRKKVGLSQSELAEKISVHQTLISQIERGTVVPSGATIIDLADFFGVSADYILGRDDNNINPASLDKSVVDINVYGTIPAGVPIEAIEDIIDTEQIPSSWLSGGREYFALIVRGDSMYPVYLDGDTVIVRKENTCKTGDDCVVYINGYDATLKRVKLYDDGSIEICPINTNYAPRRYSREEAAALPVQIGGVVVELRRRMK